MKRYRLGGLAVLGISLCLALATFGCGKKTSEPPTVDLTGSWTMDSTLASATCSNAFIVLLATAGFSFAPTVNVTMIQQQAQLTFSAPHALPTAMTGTVSAATFAVSGQTSIQVGNCQVVLGAGVSGTASTDGKTFIGAARTAVQTNGSQDCLDTASCTIDWSSTGTKTTSG